MAGPGILPITQRILISGQTAANNFILPANCALVDIFVFNTTANAITGGLKFGTTSGATDIITALAVGASAFVFTASSALSKRVFSPTATQQIFFDAVSAWNSANVNITIIYENLNNG
jgi:hypothetical protein